MEFHATPPSLLFIVSGPAGSGKTTLCERMLREEAGVERVVTSTTRAPRPGEQDRIDYYFFDRTQFETRVAAGEFYEHATVHGNLYGTLRSEIREKLDAGKSLLLNIDVQGAATFRATAKEDPLLEGRVVTIFIMPPDGEELEQRLRGRGTDADAEIERRLKVAQEEMRQWPDYDYCLPSGSREEDFDNLRSILRAERMRVR